MNFFLQPPNYANFINTTRAGRVSTAAEAMIDKVLLSPQMVVRATPLAVQAVVLAPACRDSSREPGDATIMITTLSDRSTTIDCMPRPANPDVRRRLLVSGLALVHSHGFAASGVKDITDGAGVPKGSFYAYFASKEAFAAAILEHYWADIELRLVPILEAGGSTQERIEHFFHALADEHEASDFLLGCLVGNMSLELGGTSEPVRAELDHILGRWDGALAACVRAGQSAADVQSDLDPEDLAALLIEAWEGAALRGKVTRSRTPYTRFEKTVIPALLR